MASAHNAGSDLATPPPQHTPMANADPMDAGIKGCVLCIEDSPISMYMVEAAVADYPLVTLLKAENATDGLRLAREQQPDLVLLDMHLPDMNGLEVVRALNQVATRGDLQIVLLTADSLTMDIVKGLSLGACDYWRKPLSLAQLREGLERTLKRGAKA